MKHIKRIGILTAGGDCPGLNAAKIPYQTAPRCLRQHVRCS